MTHLYCLLAPGSAPPPAALAGIGGAAVRVLRAVAADAWVSDAGEEGLRDVAAARAHDAVVSAALAGGTTPVPVRFGQRFPSDAACVTALDRDARVLGALLERVAGRIEMTVVARLTADALVERAAPTGSDRVRSAASSGAGREYLEHLKDELAMERNLQRQAGAIRRRVATVVEGLAQSEQVRVTPPPVATCSLSHLIARDAEERYRAAIASLAAEPGLPPLVVLGPNAPYRFAELPDARG